MIPDENLHYMVGQAPVALTRVAGTRLISPARDEHIANIGARLSRSSRLRIEPHVPNSFLVVSGDEAKLGEAREYRDIASTRSAFRDPWGHEFILTDEVIASFSEELSDTKRRKLVGSLPCAVLETSGNRWRLRVTDPDDDAPLAVANALSGEKGVEFAEPNALQFARFLAAGRVTRRADNLFKWQWHLKNTGQQGGTRGADVKAEAAWRVTEGSSQVRVVIHDSGVDIDHIDLKANMGPGWDFDNSDSDASNDQGPHGTACAGVVAATRNGRGVVGIAPKCTIIPLRAAGAHTWETWARTFDWAAANGEVISCSWSISPNNTLSDAVRRAATQGRNGKGIPVFFATGNDNTPFISYPASLPETIAVGASDFRDERAYYSNYGDGIDFVAPSGGGAGSLRIETTDVMGKFGYNQAADGHYCKAVDSSGFSGTSSATPLAAGIGALLLSANPDLTAADVRRILRDSCDKIDPEQAAYDGNGWSRKYGYGRLNAARALELATRSVGARPRRSRRRGA